MLRVKFHRRTNKHQTGSVVTLPDDRAAVAIKNRLAVEVEQPPIASDCDRYTTKRVKCLVDCGAGRDAGAVVTILESEADALIAAGQAEDFPVAGTDATLGTVLGASYATRVKQQHQMKQASARKRYAVLVLRSMLPQKDDTAELAGILEATGYTPEQLQSDVDSAKTIAQLTFTHEAAMRDKKIAKAEFEKESAKNFDPDGKIAFRHRSTQMREIEARQKLRLAQINAPRLFPNGATVQMGVE